MKKLRYLGGILLFLLLCSCPTNGSLPSLDEKIDSLVHWAAEFGYNCAVLKMSKTEMHRLLRERKENK